MFFTALHRPLPSDPPQSKDPEAGLLIEYDLQHGFVPFLRRLRQEPGPAVPEALSERDSERGSAPTSRTRTGPQRHSPRGMRNGADRLRRVTVPETFQTGSVETRHRESPAPARRQRGPLLRRGNRGRKSTTATIGLDWIAWPARFFPLHF